MSWLIPSAKELFFSRQDSQDPRWGEIVEGVQTDSAHWASNLHPFCILGYPDDEGIALNGGRLGSQDGPAGIRRFLYRMTPSPFTPVSFRVSDLGDLSKDCSLEERHERGKSLIYNFCRSEKNWLSLGGGHDYGYCDAVGFTEAQLEKKSGKPLIINFDAHLDVRPTGQGFHSGTPFYRLLEKHADQIHFLEVGIQPQCNSRAHTQFVLDHGGRIVGQEEIREWGLLEALKQAWPEDPQVSSFLSLDIDVFSSSEAPGCSQSWPWGIRAQDFFPCLRWMMNHSNLCGVGIYEVSPPLDLQFTTQKLAALVGYEFFTQKALQNLARSSAKR